jgi:hypothetical protein
MISKPFDPDALLRAVRATLDNRRHLMNQRTD